MERWSQIADTVVNDLTSLRTSLLSSALDRALESMASEKCLFISSQCHMRCSFKFRTHHSHIGTRPPTTHHENKPISPRRQKTEQNAVAASSRDEHRDLATRRENQTLRPTHQSQRCSLSRSRLSHQMRVSNIYEPQTGVDVSKYPLKGRPKLFDATVAQSLLYASGTWTRRISDNNDG